MMLMVFFYIRLWRHSGLLTDAGFIKQRYFARKTLK
jgi:hypothetical protein